MKKETFEKSRLYGLDKEHFAIFKILVEGILISSLELYFGFISYLWYKSEVLTERFGMDATNEIHVSIVFVVLSNTIGMLKGLPTSIYSTFVLEAKHGFNKQTPMFFIKDQIKAFVVGQVIWLPISSAIIFIVQWGGEYFFVYLWLFIGFISLLLLTIYPVFIAPLFDKYRPLDAGPLRTSIEALAASLKFPLAQLYVVEGSKRSAHSNAYFYGLWGSKRIVLFDTLLLNKGKAEDDKDLKDDEKGKGCEDKEVLAVLAHELGHWKLGHITKNLIIMQVHLFLMFFAFGYLFKYNPFYRALGFMDGKQPVLVGLTILQYVLAAYNAVLSFAMKVLSRKFEYQADHFAIELGYAKDLSAALIKLHIDNLGFPCYDKLYSAWNHSHPTLLQRLEKLDKTVAKGKDKKTQ